MSCRVLPAATVTLLLYAGVAGAQVPNLTRSQRALLNTVVAAVDAAQSQPETADISWQQHVMRASDGAHYVAFTIEPPRARSLPPGPALLYVRLATASSDGTPAVLERSAIREWLAGSRTDPRLLPKRGLAIGEMPTFGAGSSSVRGPTPSSGSTDLKLMALERERAREAKNEEDRRRRAELEGRTTASRELLPFEDFDLSSQSARADGTRIVSRAFTAGPGDYDLFVAWADPSAAKPNATVQVVRRAVHLPPARTAGITLSSIILADRVAVRAAPYSPTEQASHPYAIGVMEITPSLTSRYGRENDLSVAFQVINAESNDAGMPDVAVTFRIVRVSGDRESAVASLNPQYYNASTIPGGFNLRNGHPLFAAVSAPLATLTRGEYRLKIQVADRIAGTATAADTGFTIVGTPASLLAEAPPLAAPFTRDAMFEPGTLTAIIEALAPASPSPALTRALTAAKNGRLADLLVEEPVPAAESGIRVALTGLAYLSIGESSAAAQFERAVQEGAPAAMTQFLLGCARAAQSRDAEAIAAWQAARTGANAPPLATRYLIEALLRRNDTQRAADLLDSMAPSAESTRLAAAVHLAAQRERDAIDMLERHLNAHRDDQPARWLLLRAMYALFVRSGRALPDAEAQRFQDEARAYINGRGAHAALVTEWLATMP